MEFQNTNCILFDDNTWQALLPLTYTRPVCEIRVGMVTIREKWEQMTGASFSWKTQDYLSKKYPLKAAGLNLLVNGAVLPGEELVREISELEKGSILCDGDKLIAASAIEADAGLISVHGKDNKVKQVRSKYSAISKLWHIFQLNGQEINSDFIRLTKGRQSAPLSKTNNIINHLNIFVEEGVSMEYCTVNATSGPVYLGRHTEVMEGSMIRGPFVLCEGSQVKMGAKIYGPTTIGPHSKAGGEINNLIVFGYSNKVHDGYLGNAVLGEWCNIGADTNASNLKNNYGNIKVWSYTDSRFEDSGQQFCGLIMGDHSRCGINTMFNTGTVVGVCSNIYGAGYPRTFIPSFSMGGPAGFKQNRLTDVITSIERAMQRRSCVLNETDTEILKYIHDNLDSHDKWR